MPNRQMTTEADFAALAAEPDLILPGSFFAAPGLVVVMMSENYEPTTDLIVQLLEREDGFTQLLALDHLRLYGERIYQLFLICGSDIERFIYHLNMELPHQGTGQVSISGPYVRRVDQAAHMAARVYGRPGSFWGLKDPPTDPQYEYPIVVAP